MHMGIGPLRKGHAARPFGVVAAGHRTGGLPDLNQLTDVITFNPGGVQPIGNDSITPPTNEADSDKLCEHELTKALIESRMYAIKSWRRRF